MVAGACATPVGVRRASPREVHRELTSNVISTGELSPPTARLLRRLKLDEVFSEDPVRALAEIHAGLFPRYETFRLFALAELSFYQAEQEMTRRQEHYLAAAGPSRLVARFVKLPASLLTMGADVLTRSESTEVLRRFGRLPSSIDNMDPSSPFTRALTSIPIAEGVTPHSIIAVKDDERLEEAGDGVVEYQSAHIEGVPSELIVRSGHSVQSHPEAIEEVRRILLLHATEACRGGVLCAEAERHHGMGR